MKTVWLDRMLLQGPYLALCLSEKAFLKIIKNLDNKENQVWIHEGSNATTHFLYNNENKLMCVVCVDTYGIEDELQIFGLLAHEAMHVVQEWREGIGGISRLASVLERETEAYSLHRIFQNLLYDYKRQTACK